MDVAVVIPAYNPPASYFSDALASLAAQTYPPTELVIVDDGSDPPLDLPGYRVVRQSNSGIPTGRNNGVRATTAPLIHIFDSDELIEPEFYARLVPAFDDPAVGVAFCAMRGRVDDEPQAWIIPTPGYTMPADATADLVRMNRIGSSAAIFRRSVWEQLGGFAEYPTVHDWHFWLRASLVTRIHQETAPLAWHRRHSGQITNDAKRDQLIREEIAAVRSVDLPPHLEAVRREAVAHRWLRVARARGGVRGRAIALRAIRQHPRSALSLALKPGALPNDEM